jgi:hypothetical protein
MMDDSRRTLRTCLLRLAAERRTATYHELADLAGVPPPHRIHSLTLLLEDLVREDHAAGRPLIAASAVSRAQNGISRRGAESGLGLLGGLLGRRRERRWAAERGPLNGEFFCALTSVTLRASS